MRTAAAVARGQHSATTLWQRQRGLWGGQRQQGGLQRWGGSQEEGDSQEGWVADEAARQSAAPAAEAAAEGGRVCI